MEERSTKASVEEAERAIRRGILEGMPVRLGPWEVNAHVETRTRAPGSHGDDPPIEPGDLWYRVVLTVEDNSENIENTAAGEFASCWCWSLTAAAEAAKRLRRVELVWADEDEHEREVRCATFVWFEPIVEAAVIRFRVASEPVQ